MHEMNVAMTKIDQDVKINDEFLKKTKEKYETELYVNFGDHY